MIFCSVSVVDITYFAGKNSSYENLYICDPFLIYFIFSRNDVWKTQFSFQGQLINLLRTFHNLLNGLLLVARSMVPVWIIMWSGFDWRISSTSSLILPVVAPCSLTLFNIESPTTKTFFLPSLCPFLSVEFKWLVKAPPSILSLTYFYY